MCDLVTIVLALLLTNAAIGAFDTLWYHEYKARLSAHLDTTRTELGLHTLRDGLYVLIYGGFAWWRPSGWFVHLTVFVLLVELVVTLADFVVEDRDRPAIGGIAPGERIAHTIMAIVYGAMLTFLLPILANELPGPTALIRNTIPTWMSVAASITAVGIALSGIRDGMAATGRMVIGRSEGWRPGPNTLRPNNASPNDSASAHQRQKPHQIVT